MPIKPKTFASACGVVLD